MAALMMPPPPLNVSQEGGWEREQARYIALPPGAHTMIGIPGGGKTRTLLGRVARLVRDGVLTPDGFLLLSYSKDAAEELRVSGELMVPGLFTKENTCTLHALSLKLAASDPDTHALLRENVSTFVRCFLQRMTDRQTASGVAFRHKLRRRMANLRAIFVDEAQDLCEYEYTTLRTFSRLVCQRVPDEGGGTHPWLELVGDPDQTIFESMKTSSATFLMAHAATHGGESVHLRINFRSTRSIVRFANALRPSMVGAAATMEASPNAVEGVLPRVVHGGALNNVRAAVDHIVSLRAAGVALETVAVMGMVRRTMARNGKYTFNAGLSYVANLLDQLGIPFAVHYNEVADEGDVERAPATARPGVVNLLTTHSSKGRAWAHVVVLNFNLQTMGFFRPVDEIEEAARLVYVAATRPRASLVVYVNTGDMWNKPEDDERAPDVWYPPVRVDLTDGTSMGGSVHAPNAPMDLLPPPPHAKKHDAKLRPNQGVTAFVKKMFDLNKGEFEFKLITLMAEHGMVAEELANTPPFAPIKLDDVHHNDATILGKCAELLVKRAHKLVRGQPFVLGLPTPHSGDMDGRVAHKDVSNEMSLEESEVWQARTSMLSDDPIRAIYNHCLYDHQLNNEAKYASNDKHREKAVMAHLRAMEESLKRQGEALSSVLGGTSEVAFQVHVQRRVKSGTGVAKGHKMYHGLMDATTTSATGESTICEFKFSPDKFNFRSIMQLVLYAHGDAFPQSDTSPAPVAPAPRLLLWNLRLGTVTRITYDRAKFDQCLVKLETLLK